MAACTNVTPTKAQVQVELGLYMVTYGDMLKDQP